MIEVLPYIVVKGPQHITVLDRREPIWFVIDVEECEVVDAWGDRQSAEISCQKFLQGVHPRSRA